MFTNERDMLVHVESRSFDWLWRIHSPVIDMFITSTVVQIERIIYNQEKKTNDNTEIHVTNHHSRSIDEDKHMNSNVDRLSTIRIDTFIQVKFYWLDLWFFVSFIHSCQCRYRLINFIMHSSNFNMYLVQLTVLDVICSVSIDTSEVRKQKQ
jgi:hypothetical protein